MRYFDKKLRKYANENKPEMPDSVAKAIQNTLVSLPEKNTNRKVYSTPNSTFLRPALAVACFAIVFTFFVLPNINPNIAYAMEKIPVIGKVVHVITIKNYKYSDPYHELDVEVPSVNIKDEDETNSYNNEDAEKYINASVEELTNTLIDEFYQNVDELGVSRFSLTVDYNVITNNDSWFTLRICVSTCTGSGDMYYKFYHIDKTSGKIIVLEDLFNSDTPYLKKISKDIKRQMKEQMANDEGVSYFLNSEYEEWEFNNIDKDQNFYFADNGNIVIVFDKYEVAPGSMGTPEFEINKSIYENYLKQEYK